MLHFSFKTLLEKFFFLFVPLKNMQLHIFRFSAISSHLVIFVLSTAILKMQFQVKKLSNFKRNGPVRLILYKNVPEIDEVILTHLIIQGFLPTGEQAF